MSLDPLSFMSLPILVHLKIYPYDEVIVFENKTAHFLCGAEKLLYV